MDITKVNAVALFEDLGLEPSGWSDEKIDAKLNQPGGGATKVITVPVGP